MPLVLNTDDIAVFFIIWLLYRPILFSVDLPFSFLVAISLSVSLSHISFLFNMPPRFSQKTPPRVIARPQLPRPENPGPLPTVEEVKATSVAKYKCLTCRHHSVPMYLDTPHCFDCVTRSLDSCSHCESVVPVGYYHDYGDHVFTCRPCVMYQYHSKDFTYGAAHRAMFPPPINTTYPTDFGYYTNQQYYQQGDQMYDYNCAGPNGLVNELP